MRYNVVRKMYFCVSCIIFTRYRINIEISFEIECIWGGFYEYGIKITSTWMYLKFDCWKNYLGKVLWCDIE